MNPLQNMEKLGFKITWKLIQIGLHGTKTISPLWRFDELFEYLCNVLNEINEQTDKVVSLVCEWNDVSEVNRLLKKFAKADPSMEKIQIRKCRAYLLKTLLDNLNSDCLQGLLELMEFWTSIGISQDCPHEFPSNAKSSNLQNYFTPSNYNNLVLKNRIWLKQEIDSIILSETQLNCFLSTKY